MIMKEQDPEHKLPRNTEDRTKKEKPAIEEDTAEGEQDPYADSVALFSLLVEEHLTHNTLPITRMWTSVLEFFDAAQVPFDAVKLDKYPGEQIIPGLEARLAQDVQQDYFMMGVEDDQGFEQDMVPPFIIIMNGEEEIVFFSRVQNSEVFILSPKDLPAHEDWSTDASLRQAVGALVTKKFDEHTFYSRYYRSLTADDLPRSIKRFLIKTVTAQNFS